MRRADLKIRVVQDSDAEAMGRLAAEAECTIRGVAIDWSRIAPYWLVVEASGEIVGAIQICPGKPIGRIECLLISPRLGWKTANYARALLFFGAMNTLRAQGSQLASSVVTLSDTDTVRFLKKRGGAVLDTGHLLAWRLA